MEDRESQEGVKAEDGESQGGRDPSAPLPPCTHSTSSSSPGQPRMVKTLLAASRAVASMADSWTGLLAASTTTLNGWDSSMISQRPGITSTASMPATMVLRGIWGEGGAVPQWQQEQQL